MRDKIFILLTAFLLAMTSCGDDKSSVSAPDDETSQEEDSSSSSKKSSSSSKKGSSSSTSSSSSHRAPLSSSSLFDVSKIETGSFTDKRDGHKYKTVTIDGQTWMAQNLNYAKASSLGCHEGDNKDCTKYGRIYTWGDILDSTKSHCGLHDMCSPPLQGICPDGWRIPDEWEWVELLDKLYGSSPNFHKWAGLSPYLFSKDNDYYEGIDAYGLSIAVPGKKDQAALDFFTIHQWSSAEPEFIRFDYWGVDDYGPAKVTAPASLRCIKGDLIPDITRPTTTLGVRGNDRKECNGVEPQSFISTMACNKNGENKCIKETDGSIRVSGWTHSSNNKTDAYGPFYLFFEEKGKKTCPFEWHIPSKSEWDDLLYTVGGTCFAGYTLKAQEGWGDDYALDAFGVGIKPTDGNEARFLIGGSKKGEITGSVVFAKGSNIATFKDDTANVSGLLCMKGRLYDDTISFMNPNIEYGEFTDKRDNRTYKTIDIGPTRWMAENLNFETDSSVCDGGTRDINSFSCNRYGRYYLYEDALTACPAGWRLPTKEELDTMIYIATPYRNARSLVSQENTPYKGKNSSGFSLVVIDEAAYLWSSTEVSDSVAQALRVYYGTYSDTVNITKLGTKGNIKLNVRCVSEEKVVYGYKGTYGTLVDERDGHEYKTVEINGTTWMAENLKYESKNSTCRKDSCDIYGLHYTYPFDSTGSNPLCPDGWHVSTTTDWDSLLAFVRANDSATYALDLRYTFRWPSYSQGGDTYGMGIIPNTCYRYNDGYDLANVSDEAVACIGAEDVENERGYYYIMSSTQANSVYKYVYKRTVNKSDGDHYRFGIRCVKDK